MDFTSGAWDVPLNGFGESDGTCRALPFQSMPWILKPPDLARIETFNGRCIQATATVETSTGQRVTFGGDDQPRHDLSLAPVMGQTSR